jgi:hypothetical protein
MSAISDAIHIAPLDSYTLTKSVKRKTRRHETGGLVVIASAVSRARPAGHS